MQGGGVTLGPNGRPFGVTGAEIWPELIFPEGWCMGTLKALQQWSL